NEEDAPSKVVLSDAVHRSSFLLLLLRTLEISKQIRCRVCASRGPAKPSAPRAPFSARRKIRSADERLACANARSLQAWRLGGSGWSNARGRSPRPSTARRTSSTALAGILRAGVVTRRVHGGAAGSKTERGHRRDQQSRRK